MKEIIGDLFQQKADAICITTNGGVRKDGAAIMGRGCAKTVTEIYPGIQYTLGRLIKENGNVVQLITCGDGGEISLPQAGVMGLPYHIISFPVKHNFYDKASLKLIQDSCKQLIKLTDEHGWNKIIIPRPGCGNGKLDWKGQVKPITNEILDDRFEIITDVRFEEKEGSSGMKIGIVGSVEFKNLQLVSQYVINNMTQKDVLVSGGAEGVDGVAEYQAKTLKISRIIHEAQWQRYGKPAGPIRNQLIVNDSDRLVAFWNGKSRGTMVTVEMAVKKGIPVEIYDENNNRIR